MAEINYEIVQSIAVISETESGWTKELNKISWNGKEPKYDLRSWSKDHTSMSKGITLSEKELIQLKAVLEELL